jgi:hypothetical protein
MSFLSLDTLAVLIIIAIAAWYAFRKLIVRKDSGCCGCTGECASKGTLNEKPGCTSTSGCCSAPDRGL